MGGGAAFPLAAEVLPRDGVRGGCPGMGTLRRWMSSPEMGLARLGVAPMPVAPRAPGDAACRALPAWGPGMGTGVGTGVPASNGHRVWGQG